jgi:hypothetical protein
VAAIAEIHGSDFRALLTRPTSNAAQIIVGWAPLPVLYSYAPSLYRTRLSGQ